MTNPAHQPVLYSLWFEDGFSVSNGWQIKWKEEYFVPHKSDKKLKIHYPYMNSPEWQPRPLVCILPMAARQWQGLDSSRSLNVCYPTLDRKSLLLSLPLHLSAGGTGLLRRKLFLMKRMLKQMPSDPLTYPSKRPMVWLSTSVSKLSGVIGIQHWNIDLLITDLYTLPVTKNVLI